MFAEYGSIFVSLNKNDKRENVKILKNTLTSPIFCVTIDAEQEKTLENSGNCNQESLRLTDIGLIKYSTHLVFCQRSLVTLTRKETKLCAFM